MGGFLQKAMSLVPFLIDAVQWVEKCLTSGKGQEKQDAAVQLVLSMLHISQQVTQKQLLSSATVDQCARKVIDAVVALENAIEEFENNKSG
jgi:hypothetical protein